MYWYQHSTGSHDDPDISDAWDELGDFGYVGFFVILEIYGQEFSHRNSDDFIEVSVTFLRRKLRKSLGKVTLLLNFYKKRNRILSKIDGDRIYIKVPKFIELASNWSKRRPTEAPTEAPTAKEENRIEKKRIEVISTTDINNNGSEGLPPQSNFFSEDFQDLNKTANELLTYLNQKAGKNFPEFYEGKNEIVQRLAEGKLPEQFKLIIDKKLKDPDFNKNFMRPETLFARKNFDKYLYEEEKSYGNKLKLGKTRILEGDKKPFPVDFKLS